MLVVLSLATPNIIAPFAELVAKGSKLAVIVPLVILLALSSGISSATKALKEGLPFEPFGAANT